MDILESALQIARDGFDQVNAVQGLIIALVAALVLPSWRRLPMIVVGATAVHIAADVLLPVIVNSAELRLPEFLDLPFWRYVAALLVGYALVITLFALIKRLFLKK